MTKWISVTATIVLYAIMCDAQYPWVSVQLTKIGNSNLKQAEKFAYDIPSVIPNTAREVFILVGAYQGNFSIQGAPPDFLKIYTQQGNNTYEQYLYLYSYIQNSFNTNSENMWFPMPSNRNIFLEVPIPQGSNCAAELYAIGYR